MFFSLVVFTAHTFAIAFDRRTALPRHGAFTTMPMTNFRLQRLNVTLQHIAVKNSGVPRYTFKP